MTEKELAKIIKENVEWLEKEDLGCCTTKLDDKFAVCVGWSNGYDPNDETVIHSKEDKEWGITAAIKVWISDDLRTDFDWIDFPIDTAGEVWDTSTPICRGEDYEELARYFLEQYRQMLDAEI